MKAFVDAYLFGNLGDDLFLDILLERYPKTKFVTLSHFYRSQASNLKVYNDKIWNKLFNPKWIKQIVSKDCDLYLTIGGSMYIENHQRKKEIAASIKNHYILGVNFGPYHSDEFLLRCKELFANAKDVCFREKRSFELFQDLNQVRYAPDIIFNLKTADRNDSSEKRAVFSVISCQDNLQEYRNAYENKMTEWAKTLFLEGYQICFMSFCQVQKDEEAVNRMIQNCDFPVEKYFYRGNRDEALSVLSHSEIIVGTRFHAIILGLIFNKKVLPISYSKKTDHVLEDLGFHQEIVHIENISHYQLGENLFLPKINVSQIIEQSQLQFKELDKVLKRK